MNTPTPTHIALHQKSKLLTVVFDTGEQFDLPCEYLRVYSQSAEVTGHTPDQAVLQVNKQDVNITAIQPVGNYAIQPTFDDGHDSGIYSWQHLYYLGKNYPHLWQNYLERLQAAGHLHPAMKLENLLWAQRNKLSTLDSVKSPLKKK